MPFATLSNHYSLPMIAQFLIRTTVYYRAKLPVHACLGIPLLDSDDNLLGVITLDSLDANAFDSFDLELFTQLGTLCSAHLQTVLKLQQYQNHAQHSSALVQELNREALTRDGAEIIGQSTAMQALRSDIKLVDPR